ncbi:MAG: hypothetical protein R2830_01325 [Saprospiraceae bacterium]
MKKFIKIAGVGLTILTLVIAGVLTWVNLSSLPTYPVQAIDIQVPKDSLSIAKGRKIAETVCAYCHRSENGVLDGRMFTKPDSDFGEIWAGNLTHHANGLNRYSDGELAYLLRTGIKRDGKFLGPFMLFPTMSDKDLGSLIAYLRSDAPSLQASEAVHTTNYSLLAKALMKFGALKPMTYEGKAVEAPSNTNKVAYGRYLATSNYMCYECHSGSFETNDVLVPENSVRYFGGGSPVDDMDFNIITSPNLTPHPEHGIGQWTYEQFKMAVTSGIRPDGRALSTAMPRFALLDDAELDAIWAYLKTVPPLGPVTAKAEN